MPKNSSWGIEVGSDGIKAIRLVGQRGEITVDAYEVVPFKRILTTPDLDVDEAIREGLSKLLSKQSIRTGTVTVSVPGSAAFAKFAKLPPVDPKKIPDIVKFEAVQQIPFPIEDVEWDYQVFTHVDSPDVEVGIFAITKDRLQQFLDNYQAVGLNVDGVTLSALAVYNALAYDLAIDSNASGTIFMDIGTSSTEVIIVEGDNLWLRTLPIGGNNFTEALVRAFKLSFAKAEKLKREAATSKYARQIFQAMRPVFADLIQEVQRTLGYYQTQSIDRDTHVATLIGVGSSFRLSGMQKFLRQQLQMEVRRLDGFKRIGVDGVKAADFASHSLNLVTAYGLALQGLGLEQVHANLLPVRLIRRRLWRTKQPWFVAAAVLVAVGCIAAWVRLQVDQRVFSNNVSASQPRVEQTVDTANQYVQAWRRIEGSSDPRRRVENLRRILDYRQIWPKLMHDLVLAVRTLDPQRQLLTSDYKQAELIPRSERRRVYIDSISAQYQFGADHDSQRPDGLGHTGPSTIQEIWGNQPDGKTTGGGSQKIDPPTFVITVKGTTPYHDGPKLISQKLIHWLNANGQRQDRPYRILPDSASLESIKQIASDDADVDTLATRHRGPRRAAGNGHARRVRPSEVRRFEARPDGGDSGLAPAHLFPRRPLSTESRVGDWVFELQWTIQLIRPEDARRAEDPA